MKKKHFFLATVQLLKMLENTRLDLENTRDGSIPKFQPMLIPILEFACQPILEFPNYL